MEWNDQLSILKFRVQSNRIANPEIIPRHFKCQGAKNLALFNQNDLPKSHFQIPFPVNFKLKERQ